jgi:hypothetical protein
MKLKKKFLLATIMKINPEIRKYFFFNPIRGLFIILVMLIFVFKPFDGMAQEPLTKKVKVVGTGMVRGENAAAARDQAITNSLISAVNRVVFDILSDEALENNFKIIDKVLFNNTGNFIREYQVLNESEGDRSYRVLVSATVLVEKVREQLISKGILLSESNLPGVIFFVAEKKIGDVLPQYWWGEEPFFSCLYAEKSMAEVLREKGFKIIDHQGIDLCQGEAALANAVEANKHEDSDSENDKDYGGTTKYINDPYLSNTQALQLGRRIGAEVVIVGLAEATVVPNTMGQSIRSFKATVKVTALRTDTGEVIVSLAREAVAVNPDETIGGEDALKNAGALAGMVLANRISEAGKIDSETQDEIRILVKGKSTGNLGKFVTFRRSLEHFPGVSDLQIVQIKPDETLLKAKFEGSSNDFAEMLLRQSFDTFGINIFEVDQKQLKIELVPIKDSLDGT